jgi:hypothetical protein
MDEGAFDQNFTWYEWGFVNPTDVPHDDLAVPSEKMTNATPAGRPAGMAVRMLEHWDEEHRWPT